MPSTLSTKICKAIAARGLTLYGAAQLIGAETDEPLKQVHYRLSRYTKDLPLSIKQLEETLDALGYRLEIVEK